MPTANEARLLFVVSNDYGELGNALQFVTGQECARRATLLLPRHLYAANAATLPAPSAEYATTRDILAAVDQLKPATVFLFSGYLYTTTGLCSIESLEALVRSLQGRNCRLVTSDPFLGAAAAPETAAELASIHPPFRRAFELLQDAVHFYPVPVRDLPRRLVQMSVFNAAWACPSSDGPRPATARFLTERGADASSPFWLFVLSSEDYKLQVAKHGAGAVARHVISMFRRAVAARRVPVFIGPPTCIDSITARVPDGGGAILEAFCPHSLFTSLLLDAEYAFYWNMFSNSLVVRLGSGLPSFFFDVGHLGRWYEAAVRNYLQGWRPVCLDQRQELQVPVLKLLEILSRPHLRRIQDYCRTAPSPDEAIVALLQGQPA